MGINTKPLAKHGISGVKYVERIGENKYGASPVDFLYTENIGLSAMLNTQDVYADNKLLLKIPSDQGEDGQLGSTAPDTDFEIAAGMKMKLDNGMIAVVKQVGFKRMALYYEVTLETETGPKIMKVWTLNVTFTKPNDTNATDTAQIALNSVVYPFTVYGEPVMKTVDEKYTDNNGVGRTALRVISMPGDTGYDTFQDAVPLPQNTTV